LKQWVLHKGLTPNIVIEYCE